MLHKVAKLLIEVARYVRQAGPRTGTARRGESRRDMVRFGMGNTRKEGQR